MFDKSGMPWSTLSRTIPTAIFTILASYALWESHAPFKKRQRLRQKLPGDIETWRIPGDYAAHEQIWINLDNVFRDAGITLWPNAFCLVLRIADYPSSSGFGYTIPTRGKEGAGSLKRLRQYNYHNTLSRAARTRDGHDVIIRVIVIGNEGHNHLNILRKIATGENILLSTNHTLPMFMEFPFEDIVFGIFPLVGGEMSYAFGDFWPNNSVGDIIDMLMQMLEALEFIHDLNIAHRDAFHDNFVIQWQPESLQTMKVSISRPRVYLIDFETAVQFPVGCPLAERVSVALPFTEMYTRPHAPEFTSGNAYNPFKLDIWQLGYSFCEFKSTIPAIDEVVLSMTDIDPVHRLDAKEVKDRLGTIYYSMTPESLLIKPDVD